MIITVQCPACETSFPVDPRKVPEGGVKVRCSSCSGIFFVAKPEVPSVADLAPSAEPEAAAPAPAATPAPAPVEAPEPVPVTAPEAAQPDLAEPESAAFEAPEPEPVSYDAAPAAFEAPEPEPVSYEDAPAALDAPAPLADEPAPFAEAPVARHEEAASAEAEQAESHRDDAFEDAFGEVEGWDSGDDSGEVDTWSGAEFDDPSDGVHHDHGSPDPWAGGMDLPEAEESLEAPAADAAASPVVERLETVEDVTRAAAAEFPAAEPLDDPDDAWGDAAPAAEAPVSSFEDEPSDVASQSAESGASVEVAAPPVEAPAPPVEAPAPSKFQFGRRDPDDKARRLARVLVSDIITYNPERHQNALEQDTLHADFEDEIRKSWAEYVEQVGRELAESTPYWFDALNEILARGRKVF